MPSAVLQGETVGTEMIGEARPGQGPARAADYAVCRRIISGASRNYAYASRLLPPDRRRHVDALYAVMRVGDDRVDVGHPGFASPEEAIGAWEEAYYRAFQEGDSPEPVLRAYVSTSLVCDIPPETLAAYFRAMRDDLTVRRYATYADLDHYMEGSAVPVGRALTHILEIRPPHTVAEALPGADALSRAMQLSNFCRDVGEDWALGRLYLPTEDLERFGYAEADLENRVISSCFVDLMEYQFSRIEGLYRQAESCVPMLAAGRWAAMAALEIYRAILGAIRRNGYDVFARRAETSRARKFGLAARALWRVQFGWR